MLSSIRPGQPIVARAAAWPDQPFRGQIATIVPVIDPATRAVTVRAVLPNPDRRLKPGMLLTVAIETQPRMSLSVPELAVIGEGDERFVFRSEEHTSELQSLMRISYAVFCLKKKKKKCNVLAGLIYQSITYTRYSLNATY